MEGVFALTCENGLYFIIKSESKDMFKISNFVYDGYSELWFYEGSIRLQEFSAPKKFLNYKLLFRGHKTGFKLVTSL